MTMATTSTPAYATLTDARSTDLMPSSKSPIAYVTSRYPLVTHTFIQREVAGLRALGHDIVTFTVRASTPDEVLTSSDRAEADSTIAIFPPSIAVAWRSIAVPTLRHPGAVGRLAVRAVRHRWSQPVALLWRLFYIAEALVLWRACTDRGIRHLHAHHANVASDLAWLASEFGQRVEPDAEWSWSFTMHGPTEFNAVDDHDLGAKAAAAAAVACISDYTRAQLMLHSRFEHWERFRIVRCSVDVERFVPAATRRIDPLAPFSIVAVGRINAQKGFPVLIDALAELEALVDVPVRLIVAGDGPDRARLEADAVARGLDVDFRGAVGQDDILSLYHQADAFCLPSFMEGLPVVLMEALACELPVVTTDVAGIGELVEDGVTGLLARPGRPDLVARQLATLVDDPALGARLGTAGRERIIAEFDTAVTSAAMSEVLALATGSVSAAPVAPDSTIDLRDPIRVQAS